MFDEDGRKINLGHRIGMTLEGMSVSELDLYIHKLQSEIVRAEQTKEQLEQHSQAAEALFRKT